MEVSCYSMHLYCDNNVSERSDGIHEFREFPHMYTGRTNAECKRDAKRDGWKFRKDGIRICPKCTKLRDS